MLNLNNCFFNRTDVNDCREQMINEKTYIIDIIKCIKLEEMNELKEEHKTYSCLLKQTKNDIVTLMGDLPMVESELSTFTIKNNKLIIK